MSLPNELLPVGLLATPAGAAVTPGIGDRSLRFNSADSAYLNRTPESAGDRKTWTFSFWAKFCSLANSQFILRCAFSTTHLNLILNTNGTLQLSDYSAALLVTTQVFRDFSAWYHIVIRVDTTQATADDRVRIYVNGTQVTQFSTRNNPTQDADLAVNAAQEHFISNSNGYLNAYLADVYLIDGFSLDPTSFGEFDATTGVWNPIVYDSDYGTNGFHLAFSDNSTAAALGNDTSGNGNNWTPNNFSVTAGSGNDSLVDVHYNGTETDTGVGGEVRGNYCTWNSLSTVNSTYANGNLDVTIGGNGRANSTFSASSGKWYWEATYTEQPSVPSYGLVGIGDIANTTEIGNSGSDSWGYRDDGIKRFNSSNSSYGDSYTVGDVIGVAWDADNGTLTFYKNGVSQGQAFTGVTGTYGPVAGRNGSPTPAYACNFGQRAFAHSAPSGFKALCTANLPTPTIADGSDYMDVSLYTGNSGTQTISGLNFSPDLLWIKARSVGYFHVVTDKVRGDGQIFFTNNTQAEENTSRTALGTSSFTVVDDGSELVNHSPYTYVAWTWDGGSSTVSNTDGTVTSSVRASASSGFSIVSYNSGASGTKTIGHGLGAAPTFIINRGRTASDWVVYTATYGRSSFLKLNATNAVGTSADIWGSAEPTSTVFGIKSGDIVTTNVDCIAYCFAPVEGYSAFGSYIGNGNTNGDGAFVYLGFRPRWIMIRGTGTDSWIMHDTARNTYNFVGNRLWANLPDQEASSTVFGIDILSNGFKTRVNNADQGGWNASGVTYIYAAFAENPFKYARAR